jgi:type III pantothenate kinase
MKLLVDIGNTRIKWAFDNDGELTAAGDVVHRDRNAAVVDELFDQFAAVPTSACAINVAGAAIEQELAEKLRARFGIELTVVRTADRFREVANGYTAPGQLGADRWAAIVGAWMLKRRAVCVIDAGTAVTIDLVADDGRHLGGIIVPGLDLMRAALLRDTSDISGFDNQSAGPLVDGQWFGRDTRSAVDRGAVFALRATLDSAVHEFGELAPDPAVVVTGGDAERIVPLLAAKVEHRPQLVLEGLRELVAESDDA